jgi:hypothetical protein
MTRFLRVWLRMKMRIWIAVLRMVIEAEVNANVVISALIADSKTRNLIVCLNPNSNVLDDLAKVEQL